MLDSRRQISLEIANAPRKVLAVASGGGHWVQLRRVTSALQDQELVYVTTFKSYQNQVPDARFYCVCDASRWNKLRLIYMALQVVWILVRERPDVVISTGAACGYAAIRIGKVLGARTIWLDSIANVEHLSMSGEKAGRHSDLWLTQWPHLAREQGPHYWGSVV